MFASTGVSGELEFYGHPGDAALSDIKKGVGGGCRLPSFELIVWLVILHSILFY